MSYIYLREKFKNFFPLLIFFCSYFLNNSALSFDGQVEAIIHPLTSKSTKDSKNNPIKFSYQGERFEPPLNLVQNTKSHTFTGSHEYRFLLNMLNTIKTKNAQAFKQLWAKTDTAPNLYIEAPDVWQQFQEFITRSPNIYLVNNIRYGEYTILQLMIEAKQSDESVHRFKSYVVKRQNDKLVLTSDLSDDPGFKLVLLYSTYMSTEYLVDR